MGQLKQAIIEVEDLVCGCLQQGRTLNQTIRDLKEIYDNNGSNPYLSDEDLIEDKYYQFKGQ
tara:strand:+ start:188 stop:373 length:186 start_codon:yes stop_codon:yes gene_type:complete